MLVSQASLHQALECVLSHAVVHAHSFRAQSLYGHVTCLCFVKCDVGVEIRFSFCQRMSACKQQGRRVF